LRRSLLAGLIGEKSPGSASSRSRKQRRAARPSAREPKGPNLPDRRAHERARKNGATPGAFNPLFVGLALLAALVMVAVDARRQLMLAAVAYGMTVFVAVSVALARMPAFAQSLPLIPETMVAAVLTALASLAGGGLAVRATALVQRAAPDDPGDPMRA
jgi:hypothetical protein